MGYLPIWGRQRAGLGAVHEPDGDVADEARIVVIPRYPTVRLNRSWDLAGVMPVRPRNSRVKWLWEAKPRSRATPASESHDFISGSRDFRTPRRLTKRCGLTPIEFRNFLAK